ncbi:MAG: hypothetical protein KDJ65_29325 [Anaerolineae bacterium]|nr:hypothetical protein [Anaerolineae bacterium]
MSEEFNYGFDALKGIPSNMAPWGLKLEQPYPSNFGEYVLIDVTPSDIEQHHQVEVIDENGEPIRGVWVIFGFPGGGPDLGLTPSETHWRGAPAVLRGNAQRTNYAGYAQHTFKDGGEDIWIWDLDEDNVLKLPSAIVKDCTWVTTPTGRFEHTGVKLRFQRRMEGVKPRTQRLDELEARISALEAQLQPV